MIEKKVLDHDIAIAMWSIVLKDKFRFLDQWIEFVKSRQNGISKDTWALLLEFAITIDEKNEQLRSFWSMACFNR